MQLLEIEPLVKRIRFVKSHTIIRILRQAILCNKIRRNFAAVCLSISHTHIHIHEQTNTKMPTFYTNVWSTVFGKSTSLLLAASGFLRKRRAVKNRVWTRKSSISRGWLLCANGPWPCNSLTDRRNIMWCSSREPMTACPVARWLRRLTQNLSFQVQFPIRLRWLCTTNKNETIVQYLLEFFMASWAFDILR